ncbi:uncharacterized protein BO88DRAFT_94021 [Aspergillus vadensis CBS 113365]|uniref:Uncharacterized protein n=1 Tax=Aspergillus vadensis (strain CBS 113365 / IMI 142717 / IBT 24658) TaxID=1448311 RepID=A0A319BL06_ASPVC|nr:hypothetical protein BO88DRAFT_94021 [Aspergillus vadensis CBS 113365]PYH73397.1 hypothetical protein BO88DRAFT_94021 [Aspergillus vadensis CBS 113365]
MHRRSTNSSRSGFARVKLASDMRPHKPIVIHSNALYSRYVFHLGSGDVLSAETYRSSPVELPASFSSRERVGLYSTIEKRVANNSDDYKPVVLSQCASPDSVVLLMIRLIASHDCPSVRR